MKSWKLNRRAFLGRAGTVISLPLLDAMFASDKAQAQNQQPSRIMAYYVPNGMHMPAWTPADIGENYTLSKTLSSLAPVKDQVLVLSGLANRPAQPDGFGDHAAGTGSFITATHVKKTEGSDIQNGISVDQVAAKTLGQDTLFSSLELGMEGGSSFGGCDSGYSCAYARNISWLGPKTPMPKITSPRLVYDRLFAGSGSQVGEDASERLRLNKSVLDYVMEDTLRLRQRLGVADRQKLDEYFNSIEKFEKKLQLGSAISNCNVLDRPGSDGSYTVTERAKLMADLMTMAYQCDITRVQTFMLGNAASGRSFSFLGVNEGHHQISHHQNIQENFDKLEIINDWEVKQFAYLLENLKNTDEGEGKSLLDSALIFFSSEISDGNRHNHTDMPVLVAGGANGYLKSGQHIRYTEESPMANLFMSMLEAVGSPVESFGDDSTGLLDGIKA